MRKNDKLITYKTERIMENGVGKITEISLKKKYDYKDEIYRITPYFDGYWVDVCPTKKVIRIEGQFFGDICRFAEELNFRYQSGRLLNRYNKKARSIVFEPLGMYMAGTLTYRQTKNYSSLRDVRPAMALFHIKPLKKLIQNFYLDSLIWEAMQLKLGKDLKKRIIHI